MSEMNYGPAMQTQMVQITSAFIDNELAWQDSYAMPEFPLYEALYPNNVFDRLNAMRCVAQYEHDYTQVTNRLARVMTTRTHTKMFVSTAKRFYQHNAGFDDFDKQMAGFVARLTELEAVYRTFMDAIDKAVNVLKSMNSHADKV